VTSPYDNRDPRSYWRTGVVDRHPLAIGDIYRKKFSIRPNERIATAGSCFAQHITSRLREHGYDVLDLEPPPWDLKGDAAKRFGFQLYSARYGNIYTTRQLVQLAQESHGVRRPMDVVWQRNGQFFDALRPSVEPEGLPSPQAVARHRAQHLQRVKSLFAHTTLFVFTLGLTETFENRRDGTVYPVAPGVLAGSFDPAQHAFRNLSYAEVLADFLAFRALVQQASPSIRFLLTVSPVPLTATASPDHVLAATTYSKSVLRAVAGHLAATEPDIDYFPAYEIVAGIQARGMFYESNLRSVDPSGVEIVMRSFFDQHGGNTRQPGPAARASRPEEEKRQTEGRPFCEEEMLDALAR
jgi:GSCFA family